VKTDELTVELAQSEVALLGEALDSHE